MFIYTAQYPLHWSAQSTLHFAPGRPVHSDTNSTSLGSILAMQQLRTMTKSLTFPPPALIYTAERTGTLRRERKCPKFETVAKGDSNPGSLGC